ncbi:N-terminal phage integrase SAM-like domain-containing protein [Amycolatopsis sp. NBC_00348]|uniref:hypothetical protein n=1 Tax=Amycolatopsis sp. NBC_00348 TaxID=2975956 RepID=UPI002E274D42
MWIDPADSAVTVAEWVARWFRSMDLDPRTIESYRSRLRCHILPKFGQLPLGAITALGVTEWARQLDRDGYAQATVSSQLNPLSMLLTDAADERLIPFNPVRRRRRRGRRSRRAVPERIWATPEQTARSGSNDRAVRTGLPKQVRLRLHYTPGPTGFGSAHEARTQET